MQNTTAVKAPYATTPIPLWLNSVTGTSYRTLHCVECGEELLERDNDRMYRINDTTRINEVRISGEQIDVTCGKCTQQ